MDQRGIEGVAVADAVRSTGGRNVVVVIGIDRYRHRRPLENAVNDARETLAQFQRLGFDEVIKPLYNEHATGEALRALVSDDLMALGPNDSLVLFYAGHCGTRTHFGEKEFKTGYLIPVDAAEAANKVATWIELNSWLRTVSLLPAKHILVILDACHTGIALDPAFGWRAEAPWPSLSLASLHAKRSRRIITSALDDQRAADGGPAPEHSLFTGCLLEALTGGLASEGRRVATGSELALYVQRRVGAYPESQQTPDFGAFHRDERGEMLIPLITGTKTGALPNTATGPVIRPAVATDVQGPGATGRLSGPQVLELQKIVVHAFTLNELKVFLLSLDMELDHIVLIGDGVAMPDVALKVIEYYNRRSMMPSLLRHLLASRGDDEALRSFARKVAL